MDCQVLFWWTSLASENIVKVGYNHDSRPETPSAVVICFRFQRPVKMHVYAHGTACQLPHQHDVHITAQRGDVV